MLIILFLMLLLGFYIIAKNDLYILDSEDRAELVYSYTSSFSEIVSIPTSTVGNTISQLDREEIYIGNKFKYSLGVR